MTPEQIRVGKHQIMTYAERQTFWKNSEVGQLLGFDRWSDLEQKEDTKFIFNLSAEKWASNRNAENLIQSPNWNQIEAAIRELDGKSKTMVTLGTNDETYMTIGGGQSGKYVVTVTFDNFDFYTLVDLSKPDEIEQLVVGGQEGNYPAKMCVDLLSCRLAARTFVQSGKLDELLAWQEESLS